MSMTSTADSVLRAIGGTPVVRLRRLVPAASAEVLIKLESVNPTGSYKDRMALAMIEGAEARGELKAGMTVVEYTGVGFLPPMLSEDSYGEVRAIDEAEARSVSRRLAREEGILAGTSTGLNVAGALRVA